jgi:SAM-dependent methyltransferase
VLKEIMNRQMVAAQDELLRRFIDDSAYVEQMSTQPLHASIGEWLPKRGGRVLELGCGPGRYVAMLSTLGFRVTGVDPFEFPTWKILRERTSAELVDKVFAEKLPFLDDSFDHAACLGALLYFDDPERALRELHRVVKPGGKIIIKTVNSNNLYTSWTGRKLDPASKHLYTLAELTDLLERCGFRICRSFAYGFWPPFLTNFWWYLANVWLSVEIQDCLSSKLRPEYRVNNAIFAVSTKP